MLYSIFSRTFFNNKLPFCLHFLPVLKKTQIEANNNSGKALLFRRINKEGEENWHGAHLIILDLQPRSQGFLPFFILRRLPDIKKARSHGNEVAWILFIFNII